MNFIIQKEILEKTQCEKDYSCIYGDVREICSIERHFGESIFMKCKDQHSCMHKLKLNGFHKCNCQVRQEIFRNYGQ